MSWNCRGHLFISFAPRLSAGALQFVWERGRRCCATCDSHDIIRCDNYLRSVRCNATADNTICKYGFTNSASRRFKLGKDQPSWPSIDRGRQVETVQCPQPFQVIPWSRSPAEAKGPTPPSPVRPKIASAKMPGLAILIPFLFLMDTDASEPYEEAMNRQIEDDVLRKFYTDMTPGHTLYQPQSVSS